MIDHELLGEGRTAEVFACGSGRVVKLLRPGFDEAALRIEGEKTAAAHKAGVPAPSVHGEVIVDGRLGCVIDRVEGVVMLDRMRTQPWHMVRWARELADVHAAMHEQTSGALPDVRERLASKIEAAEGVGSDVRRQARRSASLPAGGAVLHGDFNPGNVVMSEGRPLVIDWLDAAAGGV